MEDLKLQALSASEESARYYLQHSDVDGLFEMFGGLVSVEVFILITQLILMLIVKMTTRPIPIRIN